LKPTRGLITLFDHDTATLSADSLAVLRRRIGVVFQDFRLLDHLTTFDNVALPLRVIGRDEESYYDEVAELLGWVGLGEHMWSLPPVLSGGEKQRAAIARAVIARPQLLLADEPTGNVDPQLAQRLLRLFIELNKSGTSVVIATHDIALMDQYDARRLVLHDGYIHVYDQCGNHDTAQRTAPRASRVAAAGPRDPRRGLYRAAGFNRRERAGRRGGDHDIPGLRDKRRCCDGDRLRERLAGGGGARDDHSGPSHAGARH